MSKHISGWRELLLQQTIRVWPIGQHDDIASSVSNECQVIKYGLFFIILLRGEREIYFMVIRWDWSAYWYDICISPNHPNFFFSFCVFFSSFFFGDNMNGVGPIGSVMLLLHVIYMDRILYYEQFNKIPFMNISNNINVLKFIN